MNDAMFQYCWNKYGDLGRFMTTAFVARDLENIRLALGEDELTGFMVSYGTGVAQTYAGMFPGSSGRIILDANEVYSEYKELETFAFNSFDNVTDAWHDGFLTDCVNAGPGGCALAKPGEDGEKVTLKSLESRMTSLLSSVAERPMPAFSEKSGPGLLTYEFFLQVLMEATYVPPLWPRIATLFSELESGNTTTAIEKMNTDWWVSDPGQPFAEMSPPSNDELLSMVMCPESYDKPFPENLEVWDSLWDNATQASWISGDLRFYYTFPCRRFYKYWPTPAEVYRGGLNKTLKTPLLLISGTYDPATPLSSGRRLLDAFGHSNARLLVHHGYGHGSHIDPSDCTDAIGRKYILEGVLPDESETHCQANRKPFSPADQASSNETQSTWSMGWSSPEVWLKRYLVSLSTMFEVQF